MPYDTATDAPYSGATETTLATSLAAARSADLTLKEEIYNAILAASVYGRTDDELQLTLGMNGDTERPRRGELERAGRIRPLAMADEFKTGLPYTRLTSKGRKAAIWIAV